MAFDFDRIIDRRGTHSIKWDYYRQVLGSDDLIPLWVADMDFISPPAVTESLISRARHPVYGYTARPAEYDDAVISWFKKRHGWHIDKETIHCTPGIVTAISLAVQTFTKPGDSIIVQTPVYNPFYDCVKKNGRKLTRNPLIETAREYTADLDKLRKTAEDGARMIILCNPHNPVGKVWTRTELEDIFSICTEHGIIMVSDEIHCDLTMPGHTYTPLCTLSEEAAKMTVACTSPSKTFNIPGLSASNIIIPDPDLSLSFSETLETLHMNMTNIFSIEAVIAAYSHGSEWLDELREYIFSNALYVAERLNNETGISCVVPEGTYLMWLDFSDCGMEQDELRKLLYQKAKVGLSDGVMYGPEGKGFMRMNIACPLSLLKKACDRLATVFPLNSH